MRWFTLCISYSQRKLTDPLDRLPAFSAIAKEFRKSCPGLGDYPAGLWSMSLPQQLLWRSYRPSCPLLERYKAPSWSWASLEDEICLPPSAYAPAKIRLEIIDYTIKEVMLLELLRALLFV